MQVLQASYRARGWLHELTSGQVSGIEEIASRERKHPRSIRTALTFAFLAPDIVEGVMDGIAPTHLTLTEIGRGLPMLWAEQRRMFRPAIAQR